MASKLTYITAALVAIIASTALATVPTNCSRTYGVVSGDTCDQISVAQNVSTYQLAKVNTGVIDAACDNLFVGETICLGITGQDCDQTYEVVSGDSCAAIATAAGIDLSMLLTNNPNVAHDCSNIYPGEVLCIASSVIPYTS